jgi:Domain of unknown function (DUF4304)
MELALLFRDMVSKIIAPGLKQYRFSGKGFTFYHLSESNWGLIGFQKSKKEDPEKLNFTVNLGVASGRLLKFFSPPALRKKPEIWDCHWRIRLGLLINGSDIWWTIERGTSIDELGKELLSLLINLAIPEINYYIKDTNLINLWLSERSPSLTEFQRLLYLSVLINELGPSELLKPTILQLKQLSEGKPSAITAEFHIKKLLET